MIISRTPFRVSFVGGGTDLEAFCNVEPGAAISSAINKYIYVTVKPQVAIASYRYRISWNKLEFKNNIDEIEHPIVREALKSLKIDMPLEITTFADIPSSTGLGSSSAFAVGLLNALYALRGERRTKSELAREAATLEIRRLGRKIGCQDHLAACYGSVNVFRFLPDLRFDIMPVPYQGAVLRELERRLVLFYTETQRNAWEILNKQSEKTVDRMQVLRKMKDLVEPLEKVFTGQAPLDDFGRILHENWLLKKTLTSEISTPVIDRYYETALKAGALGGKLLGAGGGGFLLLYIPEQTRAEVMQALSGLYRMPFKVDHAGTRITYYDRSNADDDVMLDEVMIDFRNQQ